MSIDPRDEPDDPDDADLAAIRQAIEGLKEGEPGIPLEEAVEELRKKYGIPRE